MQRLGKTLHLSKSGRLILRSENRATPGTIALDEDLKLVGKVFDTFGPVERPYVSVKPSIPKPELLVGHIFYAGERTAKGRKHFEYR